MAKTTYPRSHRTVVNTGFSANSAIEGSRLINRDGYANLRKTGISFLRRLSIYHSLLRMRRWPFLILVFAFYTVVNFIFALMFYFVGVEQLAGYEIANTHMSKFLTAFFFSAQTLTTVGYGHIAPTGLAASTVASVESLVGILVFALVTGIFYGRFSRPRAYLHFSDNVLVAPYRGGRAIMLRLATYKNNHLTDVEAQATAALHIASETGRTTQFFQLQLEISKITSLALSWTIVHPLNEESPMYTFTQQDFINNQVEIILNIKAFDDHFSNTVQQRTSYTASEIVFGAKFLSMSEREDSANYTTLHLDRINAHEKIALPEAEEIPASSSPVVVAKL